MKKILTLIIVGIFFLSSCSEEEQNISKKYFETAYVQSGSLLDSENYIGYTDSFNNVILSAKLGGKITSIQKNVGDRVFPLELLATLDGSEAKSGYSSSLEIINSLENLKTSTSEMFDKQIADMSYKIDQANIGIDASFTGKDDIEKITETRLKTIESQINQINSQIKNIDEIFETKRDNLYSNSKNAITNANILATNIVDFLDIVFGVSDKNRYKNDSYEIYLGAKDSSLKTDVENKLRSLIVDFENIKQLPLNSREEIKISLEKYNKLFSNDIRDLLKNTSKVFENSVSSSSFPESMILEYKNTITNLQNQNEQVILSVSGNFMLGLKGSLDNISSLEKEYNMQIEGLEKQLLILEETLNQYKAMGEGQINEVLTKTSLAEKSLEEIKDSIDTLKKQKEAKIKEIDTQIANAKASKNESSVMIENSKIISSTSGVITKKMAEVGQVVGSGMPVLLISDDSEIKIEVLINDSLKDNILVGTKVKVEIEGVSEIKTGIISKILPTRDEITKKIQVEIKIDNKAKDIKLGSFSKVYFDIKNDTNGIIIPNSAIISNFMIPGVYILEDSKVRFQNIKILKQNDNFSQVQGLEVGATIITEGKENIYDGEELEIK